MSTAKIRKWAYLFPLLHLCLCISITLGHFESGWEYLIFYIDFPISVLVMSALYSFDHPLILFGIVGTIWWFILSWLISTWICRLVDTIHDHHLEQQQKDAGNRPQR
jgi:hypothetical protein